MAHILARCFHLLPALVLLAVPTTAAESDETSTLTGTVVDQRGDSIPFANVEVENDRIGSKFRTVTDESGAWATTSLPSGSYTITVSAQDFETREYLGIQVEPGATLKVVAELQVQVKLDEETTVTASRYEQLVLNAPAAVSILSEQAILDLPSYHMADLLREVPGVNVVRTSAYYYGVNSRSAAGLYTDSQLSMVDGRTIYVDYLGATDWNFVSTDLEDIKQVEIIRGPASAVWGSYAMNGVVNVITKSPREMLGSSLTFGFGTFDRSGGAAESDAGFLYRAKFSHAQALSDRWAYKITGGISAQDAFARPQGIIPNDFGTPYPEYPNKGFTNPKAGTRIDYDLPGGKQHFTFEGGFSSSTGITHGSLGTHDCVLCVGSYGKADYTRGALRITAYVNGVNVDAPSLTFVDPVGQAVQWRGDTQTYDIGFSNHHTIYNKHLISYGGNFRHLHFDHSAMPDATGRNEGGAYFEDEFHISNHFRWTIGARIDKFGNLEGAVFSPRTALLVKPAAGQTIRVSYNRAYAAPAPVNNYSRGAAMVPLDLGLFDPQLAGNYYNFPLYWQGNRALEERSMNAYEIGYTTSVGNSRASLGAAFYINDSKGNFYYAVKSTYSSQIPPPGWPLPPIILDILNDAGMGLTELVVTESLGEVRNKGIELNAEVQISRFVDGYVNYSRQARPESEDYDISLYNQPPANRFNAGLRFNYKKYFGSVAVGYVGSAFWNDVISEAYSGRTKGYTSVDFGIGMRWGENQRYSAMLKSCNLGNATIQNHIFGDILKRQITGEFKMQFWE